MMNSNVGFTDIKLQNLKIRNIMGLLEFWKRIRNFASINF